MSSFKCISGGELVGLASAAAIAMSKQFDDDDLNILSNFYSALGSNLGVIAAQREACSKDDSN